MRNVLQRSSCVLLALAALLLTPALFAANEVMGTIEFEGKSTVERHSAVYVDGQYVGYLKELKGDKQVVLLPGEHTITVRQNGYQDFSKQIQLRPGETKVVHVAMSTAATLPLPKDLATIKTNIDPSRAAVFMDGRYVGHVGEFKGPGRGLLVPPGKHHFQIALPGYQTYEATIDAPANQTVELKTDLAVNHKKPLNGPMLEENMDAQKPTPGAMAAPEH